MKKFQIFEKRKYSIFQIKQKYNEIKTKFKAAQGYYMLDSRYRQAGYFPQEYDPHR